MDSNVLFNVLVFLSASCIAVPIASRFKLGSVLGYLVAGILIGPYALGLISNPEQIMHLAEFGVVMMLFMIGLELDPTKLWRLKQSILGIGGLQVLLSSAAFTAIGVMVGYDWRESLAVSIALSLSSTALVLQMLEEKKLMQTSMGDTSFAVLLFQDIAVIPILILLPLLSGASAASLQGDGLVASLPGWERAIVVAFAIALVIVLGRYGSRHLFHFIAKSNLREVFTATSLGLVVGITLLMNLVGVSPALGAFIAGVVLANSQYKHTLETDIEPFKGLLLGLFFISVGMGMNFGLLASEPLRLFAVVAAIMCVKATLLYMIGRLFKLDPLQNIGFALALSQGGEFAFVLFQFSQGIHVITEEQSAFMTLCVALSIAATPLVMQLYSMRIVPRFLSILPEKQFDTIDEQNPIILAGYGRFGQIIGRFLSGQGVKLTILEKDPDQIELLRKFGFRGYFGDASRLDLLISAGAEKARMLIVAVDDADTCLKIVQLAKQEFPHLKIYARARNRRHAYELFKAGVYYFKRETFDSSLAMAKEIMISLGHPEALIEQRAQAFYRHDEATLKRSFEFFEREPELISFARQANGELERILQSDTFDSSVTEQKSLAL